MPGKIEFVQRELIKRGIYAGEVDGLLNTSTVDALNQLPALYPDIKEDWPALQKAYGFLQVVCLEAGYDPKGIDGKWGPNSEFAYENYKHFLDRNRPPDTWRPEDIPDVNPNNWPRQYTPEFDAFYGPKGTGMQRADLPYPMRYSWDPDTTINAFSCHEKVLDSMVRVLSNVVDYYGLYEIQRLGLDLWGGCYNDRPIRGGTKPSMHSWAIAIDFDPDRNRLKWGRDQARFARPEYNRWWQFWEEEGWVSLGRQRNFDWMHVQAAKL